MADQSSNDGLVGLVVLAIIGGICYGIYAGLDSIGWFPHREDSVVTAQTNWFVGESKDCMSYPLNADAARAVSKEKGYAVSEISCDDGPQHSVKVTFFGQTEQADRVWVSWRCTRNADAFTCKQTGSSAEVKTSTDQNTGRPIVSYDGGKTWEWADHK